MNLKYIIEPIEFLFGSEIFKGLTESAGKGFILIEKITDAYKYAFEQQLPPGYKVWTDVVENYRSTLRSNVKFDEAYEFINHELISLQEKNKESLLEYRKKKVKKINTAYDDFKFPEAMQDAFFVLSTVAIRRYLDNSKKENDLEVIFSIYKAGGWPCGMKKIIFWFLIQKP